MASLGDRSSVIRLKFSQFALQEITGMKYAVLILTMDTDDLHGNWGFILVMLGLVMTLSYLMSHIY